MVSDVPPPGFVILPARRIIFLRIVPIFSNAHNVARFGETVDERVMDQLLGHSITYRIAVGTQVEKRWTIPGLNQYSRV